MRAWVCRARFAADRVFAIDGMKKSRHGTRLVRDVNRNSGCAELIGRRLISSQRNRLEPQAPFISYIIWMPGKVARVDTSRVAQAGSAENQALTQPTSPAYPSDGRSSAVASILEGRLSKALKTRRGRLWPFSSPWSSSIELRLASSQAAGNPGERDTI
jgi:hypothetical protein